MKKTIPPVKKGYLTSGIHRIYYEAYGNVNGVPWIFCHGGPGYHCVPSSNLKNFDLQKNFVILFDQRGSGKSKPATCLKNNNTQAIVQDMKEILNIFKISKINLLGSSWGTTLALVFAIANPDRVKSLVLKSVFLGRKKDIWDIYQPSSLWSQNQIDKFDATLGQLKKEFNIKNFLVDGAKILNKKNKDSLRFAKLWAAYEDLICSKKFTVFDFDKEYLKMAMDISSIEIHYFKNNCFLPVNFILKNCAKISHIKTYIIHGAEDMVCPIHQASRLNLELKNSILIVDPVGGHSSTKKMNAAVQKCIRQIK